MSDTLEVSVLLCLIILMFYVIGAHLIEKYKVDFIHESGMAILMGINGTSIQFTESTFFVFILPPIIFAAGYNLKKKNFVKNFGYIILFGFLGTIISFIILSTLIIFWNDMLHSDSHSILKLKTKECLLLAAVLCATDTVAALTIVKERNFPTLNSILFGEGVVNDAVSILLFRAVEKLLIIEHEQGPISIKQSQSTGRFSITFGEITIMFLTFAYLTFCSIFIGILFGLLCAYVLKSMNFETHPVREIFLILLFAYVSYIASEMLGFSGIMTLFCCGFTMAQYAFKNLSQASKVGSVLAIETIGHGAEAFVFTYLGLSIYAIEQEQFSTLFFFALLISCIIARAAGVFIPVFFLAICRRFKLSISFKQLILIWFSGVIRGAIAFALSQQINAVYAPRAGLLVTSTLVVVLATTLIFGGSMSIFSKYLGITDEKIILQSNYSQLEGEGTLNALQKSPKSPRIFQFQEEILEEAGYFSKLWISFDDKFMRPTFIKDEVNKKIFYKEYKDVNQNDKVEEYKNDRSTLEMQLEEELTNSQEFTNANKSYGKDAQSISPPSFKKGRMNRQGGSDRKEIEMKSIIFN